MKILTIYIINFDYLYNLYNYMLRILIFRITVADLKVIKIYANR